MILVDGLSLYPPSMCHGLPGRRWAHMVSDTNEAELHEFAARIGLKREWAQLRPKASASHYDLVPRRHAAALAAGAQLVTSRELVLRNYDGAFRRGGLKMPPGIRSDGQARHPACKSDCTAPGCCGGCRT